MVNTMLVPLSPLDHNGVPGVGATLGYVSDRLKFSTSKLAMPLDKPITLIDDSSAEIVDRPALKFFRHPSIPSSLASYSSCNAPIISIHITELTNCTCLGISVPHGVFDAFGLGQVLRGFDAELNGRLWTPPISSETNILRTALEELADTAPHHSNKPTALADVQRDFLGATLKNNISYGVGFASEYLWHKQEIKSIFFGKQVVERMAREVKDEAMKSGAGWASTGDILMAWLLKEHDTIPVSVMSVFSIRSLLLHIHPDFATYTHNAIVPCATPVLSKEEIRIRSLTELAVMHRQSVDAARNVSFIGAYGHWLATVGGHTIPRRRPGGNFWMASNQSIGHFDEIDFGWEIIAQWFWSLPIFPDQIITLNRFKGVYVVEASMRPSRWNAVAEVIKNMSKGKDVKLKAKL